MAGFFSRLFGGDKNKNSVPQQPKNIPVAANHNQNQIYHKWTRYCFVPVAVL